MKEHIGDYEDIKKAWNDPQAAPILDKLMQHVNTCDFCNKAFQEFAFKVANHAGNFLK